MANSVERIETRLHVSQARRGPLRIIFLYNTTIPMVTLANFHLHQIPNRIFESWFDFPLAAIEWQVSASQRDPRRRSPHILAGNEHMYRLTLFIVSPN